MYLISIVIFPILNKINGNHKIKGPESSVTFSAKRFLYRKNKSIKEKK